MTDKIHEVTSSTLKRGADVVGDIYSSLKGKLTGRGTMDVKSPSGRTVKMDRGPKSSEISTSTPAPAAPSTTRKVMGNIAAGGLTAAALGGAAVVGSSGKSSTSSSAPKTDTATSASAASAPKQTFGQAFAAARKAATEKGSKSTGQFEWEGKKYQTNIQGSGTAKKPEEKYVSTAKQTKVDTSAPSTSTAAAAPAATTTEPKKETPLPSMAAPSVDSMPKMKLPSSMSGVKTPEESESGKKKKMSEDTVNEMSAFDRAFSQNMRSKGEGKTFKWHGKDILLKYADNKPKPAAPKADAPLPPRKPADLNKPTSDIRDGRPMSGISPAPSYGDISPAPKAPESTGTLKNLPLDTSKPLGSTITKEPFDASAPSKSKQTNLEYESGGKKKKMSEESNSLIAAFLKLQDENPSNMFEAAKKAKKDYDKDGKVESPKDEVWGSRFAAAKKAGKMEEAAAIGPKGSENVGTPVTKDKPKEDPSTPKSYPGAASTVKGPNPTSDVMSKIAKEEVEEINFSEAELDHINSFFLEASVAPNRPEVATGADSTSDKMSQNDVTVTAESGKSYFDDRKVKKVKEEVELEEGRPRKNPTPETTERDPRKHIQVEAGRAAAGSVVDFHHNDGSKSKITPAMGRKITSHLQSLKPADRQAAVNKMHDSAEGLKV